MQLRANGFHREVRILIICLNVLLCGLRQILGSAVAPLGKAGPNLQAQIQ